MTAAWQVVLMILVLSTAFAIVCVGAAFGIGIYQMITGKR